MNHAEMSSRELLDLLNDIDEQDWLEAKSLRDDTSRSILETVCSFSNEPGLGGGVILIGVAENKTGDGPQYLVDGVADPDKAQLDLATQCKSVFNTPIYPTIKVEKIGGKAVLRVIVDEQHFGCNQRTALVFLREVGAIDAVAYRQLTGCKPKLVAKELAGIKDQGLMIQKGRTRGTYYVPAGSLEESIEDEKHKLISQAIAETTTPRAVITTPPAETTTPRAVITTPPAETTTPQTEITTPLPKDLIKDLENLKQHEPSQRVKKLILRLCEVHPMSKEELAAYLKRSVATVDKYAALMMGKELCFRYPMMPHHPRQAYVALGNSDDSIVGAIGIGHEPNNEPNREPNEPNAEPNGRRADIDQRLFSMIAKDGGCTILEMMGRFHVSRETVKRALKRLQTAGRLRRVGGTRGHWEVM